jgi:hypothetical protein
MWRQQAKDEQLKVNYVKEKAEETMYYCLVLTLIPAQITQDPLTQHQGGKFWTKPNGLGTTKT